jgi:membrane protease YdiL (CAAX protease family)
VFGINPLAQVQPGWLPLFWGVLGTAPLLLALTWILRQRAGGLRRLVDFVVEELGPLLARRSHAELAFLAALAGLGEELLFRGVVQTGLARVIPAPLDLLAASSLFGLAHFATATYAIVAAIMGLYLGVLFLIQGTLFAPIVTHALYDFVALLLVVRRYHASQTRTVSE